MSTDLDKIKDRIRALAAKTIDNGCTEHEAFAAMEMVGKLLTKYNLCMSDINFSEEVCKARHVDTKRKNRNHMNFVISAIAKFCDCKVWTEKGDTLKFVFFGYETDTIMAEYLCHLINTAIDNELRNFKQSNDTRRGDGRSFAFGMVHRINQRLDEMHWSKSKDMSTATGNSLVLVKIKTVENEFNETNIRLRKTYTSARGVRNHNAYNKGINAGDKVNLSRPVTA